MEYYDAYGVIERLLCTLDSFKITSDTHGHINEVATSEVLDYFLESGLVYKLEEDLHL